jgi:ABC-type transporter Mla MlaB component
MTAFRPSTIVLPIAGPLARVDVPELCERVRTLLEGSDAAVVLCDLGAAVRPDAVALEVLARVQLIVRRRGRRVRLLHASGELLELLAFAGLDGVLRVESEGQAEQREEPLRVEEEAELDDTPL